MGKKQKQYIPDIFDEYDQGEIFVDGHFLRVRYLPHLGRIDFGVGKNFDRWANSTDFSISIPRNEKAWNKKLDKVSKLLPDYFKAINDRDDDWDECWV